MTTASVPPKTKTRRPARNQVNLTLSAQTVGILRGLCERKAAEYAARGIDRDPARLQSEVVTELLYRAGASAAVAPGGRQ